MTKMNPTKTDCEEFCKKYNSTPEHFDSIVKQWNSGFFMLIEDYINPYTAEAVEITFEHIADSLRGCSELEKESDRLSAVMSALMNGLVVESFWVEDRNSPHGRSISPQSKYYCCGLSRDKCLANYQVMLNEKLDNKIKIVNDELKKLKQIAKKLKKIE